MSDRALVDRMLRGEEEAFEEFFDSNFDRLFRFAAQRTADRAAAEDVAQAAIVQGIRKIRTWRGESALFTWLCAICRRELIAHAERHGTQLLHTESGDQPATRTVLDKLTDGADDPERAAQRRELAAQVQMTLDSLPARYGDVLEWKYLEGASMRDIADRLGLTVKAVESMLTRARESFKSGFGALPSAEEAP